ncbi:hypothetical protein [Thomasclavelia cocleata]|jgi:hypothetical protein|uniref:hypothetical protein n=1 Tax=Thomasclavelia cocleata TaxID=69824 RepID=UPI0025A9B4FD|nr:hypothetical protein [Thomasclavelia cocleata]
MCLNNYLDRLNWKNVLSFIVYGAENEDEEETMLKSNLLKRISDYEKKCGKDITEFANSIFQQKELSQTIIDELSEQLIIDYGKSEDIYLELGLKIGFLLAIQLWHL